MTACDGSTTHPEIEPDDWEKTETDVRIKSETAQQSRAIRGVNMVPLPRKVYSSGRCLAFTVAGQWRIYTAFPRRSTVELSARILSWPSWKSPNTSPEKSWSDDGNESVNSWIATRSSFFRMSTNTT